ncbi:MAG: BLUF domain-containing protein [Pseudanabaenaceae cyanobacterium SKYGB_i_bin29]|nr:BLUF domain-containing protein [Pseudanabaenaceae cyanobacterium SKYG29]MDW8421412.1 BLUF domain-containing protein [Pseudanabaenaceae cyanobacterium SKYGB_i_bin29]
MSLHRLIYLSYARTGIGYSDLRDIMDKSEVNNAQAGITGMLCYGNGVFLQILEGNRKMVNQTYHRIVKDNRHHSPEIIDFRAIQCRSFPEWSMKLVQLDDKMPDNIKVLILKFSGSQTFGPEHMTANQCFQFMRELYDLFTLA